MQIQLLDQTGEEGRTMKFLHLASLGSDSLEGPLFMHYPPDHI